MVPSITSLTFISRVSTEGTQHLVSNQAKRGLQYSRLPCAYACDQAVQQREHFGQTHHVGKCSTAGADENQLNPNLSL